MPLAQHDALRRSTPISPGPVPPVVCSVSTWALPEYESGWKPKAILATSLEDGATRILRVETPSPARENTFRQAWIGEVRHVFPHADGVFPNIDAARDAAWEILRQIWTETAPVPNPPKENMWISFPGETWESVNLKTWGNPIPGPAWETGDEIWDRDDHATWEKPAT